MKVLYVCADVDIPVCGDEGSSIHVREFCRALAELGHDVTVYAAWDGGRNALPAPVKLRAIAPRGAAAAAWDALAAEPLVEAHCLARDLKSVLLNDWLIAQAEGEFAAGKPDFIYERYSLFGWAGMTLSERWGVPLVVEVNTPLRKEQDGYDQFTLTRVAERVETTIFAHAHRIVAVSAVVADWVRQRGALPDRVSVVPNAVRKARFATIPDGKDIRRTLQLGGRTVVGFVGSFQPWHDVRSLIRAFARLRALAPTLHLLLIGDGPQREELAAFARQLGIDDAVTFTGPVAHDVIPQYIGAMDIAVAPYARSSAAFYYSPIKLFEYMAAARPVVAARIGQLAELIDDGITGWLYEPGDDDGLFAALQHIMERPAATTAIGTAAREKVLKHHTWQAVAERVIGMVAQ